MNSHTAPTYSDEHIDHWGKVYTDTPAILRHGIHFVTFLVAPQNILDLINGNSLRALPLLPKQRTAQQQQASRHAIVDYDNKPEMELHGDRVMQPMHHRAAPTKSKTGGHKKCA